MGLVSRTPRAADIPLFLRRSFRRLWCPTASAGARNREHSVHRHNHHGARPGGGEASPGKPDSPHLPKHLLHARVQELLLRSTSSLPSCFVHLSNRFADLLASQELRLQDYQANRKQPTASAAPTFGGGTFGQPAQTGAFGAPAPAFGAAPSTFGQQPAATGAFGQPAAVGGLFGQPAATPAFGQAAPTTGLFGQQPQQPAQAGALFGAGTFGQPAASTSTFGGFGAAPPKPQFSFGTATPAPTSQPTGLFGQPPQQQPSAGLFGQSQAPAPGGIFGQQPAATGTFGGFGGESVPVCRVFGLGTDGYYRCSKHWGRRQALVRIRSRGGRLRYRRVETSCFRLQRPNSCLQSLRPTSAASSAAAAKCVFSLA